MTSCEMREPVRKCNVSIYLCFESRALNSWVYSRKVGLNCGQPICVLIHVCKKGLSSRLKQQGGLVK